VFHVGCAGTSHSECEFDRDNHMPSRPMFRLRSLWVLFSRTRRKDKTKMRPCLCTVTKSQRQKSLCTSMTTREGGKATISSPKDQKAWAPIRSMTSSRRKSGMEPTQANALAPISRTPAGILMLFGCAKQRRTQKESCIAQFAPVTEVRKQESPDFVDRNKMSER
jgi:hypothetical protein